MTEENPSADALAEQEAAAAAAEAARIGGGDPQPDVDPELKPVLEGGGGEAEGFEQAEEALIRQATHDDDVPADPSADAFSGEVESDRSTAEYGEGDGVDPER